MRAGPTMRPEVPASWTPRRKEPPGPGGACLFSTGKCFILLPPLRCHSIWKYQAAPAKPQQPGKRDPHKGERPQGMELPTRRTPTAQQQNPKPSVKKRARAPTATSPKTAMAHTHKRRPSTFRTRLENADRTQDEIPPHTHDDG